MTAFGVVPQTEERSQYVREVDVVSDMDDVPMRVGVDHGTVTIGTSAILWTFTLSQMEDLAHVIIAAVWEAGRNAEGMAREAAMPP